jgi:hypothetical protein
MIRIGALERCDVFRRSLVESAGVPQLEAFPG